MANSPEFQAEQQTAISLRNKNTKGRKMAKGNWIGAATAKMKARGTLGSFGKATPGKIKAGKAKGGLQAKRANFASNMKKISKAK